MYLEFMQKVISINGKADEKKAEPARIWTSKRIRNNAVYSATAT